MDSTNPDRCSMRIVNPLDYAFNHDPMPLYEVRVQDQEPVLAWANHTMGDAENTVADFFGVTFCDPDEREEDDESSVPYPTTVQVTDPNTIAAARQRCVDFINDAGPDPKETE